MNTEPDKLRISLTTLVEDHQKEMLDLVSVLSEVIDDKAMSYAQRTGDYSYAAVLLSLARGLRRTTERLEDKS